MLLVPPPLCTLLPNLAATLPGRQRNPRERSGLTHTVQVSGSTPTCRGMEECQNGQRSSDLFSTPRMNTLAMSKSKGMPVSKLWASGCKPHNRKKMACGLLHPAWWCWGERTILSQLSSRESEIIKWCGMKKQWHWPWLSRGAPLILECPQGCSVEQCKSSADALPPI